MLSCIDSFKFSYMGNRNLFFVNFEIEKNKVAESLLNDIMFSLNILRRAFKRYRFPSG